MKTRRRIIGALLALAALPFIGGDPARAQDAVSLRLNWYLGGLHVPFYYGVEKGFYKAEGINLTINEGRGSANTVQVVAAGTDTFGLADSSSVINLISKGGEIKSVMNVLSSTASRSCRWPPRASRRRRTSRASRSRSRRATRSAGCSRRWPPTTSST